MESLLAADPDTFGSACASDLAEARQAVVRFKELPATASFEEVLKAYDAIGLPLNRSSGLAHLLFQVHPDEAMRTETAAVEQEVSRFGTELSLDRELYDRLAALDPEQAPDAVSRRLLEHALRDFRRAGVDRDEATCTSVRALREELVSIGQEFARNMASDVREILLDSEADLDGLPQDFIDAHPPGEDGKRRITTNPSDVMLFLKFCTVRENRAKLYTQYASRGAPENFAVLEKLLARRHELATLLGYESWAAYVTEDKMIRTAERASEFIDRVVELTEARSQQELQELRDTLEAQVPGGELREYDRGYLTERIRCERFAFDSKDARPYFAYDRVRDGVLATAERLYGLEIRKREGLTTWHADVEAYEILEGGEPVARFFLDMHARDDKYQHAAMFNLENGLVGHTLPSACLVCNMPQPNGDDPGLMEPSDVKTFFHEFGHLLHHLLAGRHEWLATSGISTEWDFVEVPSQLFEEWFNDVDVLQTFARHHETDEPIPADLVQRMTRANEYGKGLGTRMQMFYARLSLTYYDRDPAGRDTTEILKEVRARFIPLPFEEGTSMQTAFGHLDGYSALYYTYMWSLVLAKDCLSAFGEDLMDRDVATRYRKAILEPGGSRDAEDLLQEFLGRPYSFDAFEAWLAA